MLHFFSPVKYDYNMVILAALLIETMWVVKGQTCPHTYPAEFSWPVAPELSSWFYTNAKVNELFSTPFQEQMSAL